MVSSVFVGTSPEFFIHVMGENFMDLDIARICLDFDGIILFFGMNYEKYLKFGNLRMEKDGELSSLFLSTGVYKVDVNDVLMANIRKVYLDGDSVILDLSSNVRLLSSFSEISYLIVSTGGQLFM